jgi:hypothetical protein
MSDIKPSPGRRRARRRIGMAMATVVAGVAAGLLAVPATPAHAVCSTIPSTHDLNVIRIVYQVGLNLRVSSKVMLAGFEAGWVESRMNNLPCGQDDSLGVFQQRPSQGWGSPDQVMNVWYAANKFFTPAISVAAQHPTYTAGQVAQAVQRSAHPERYDQAQAKAQSLITSAKASAAVTLRRYYNGYDHISSLTPPAGSYRAEFAQGYMLTRGAGLRPLFQCRAGSDRFTSPNSNCEGQASLGLIGYVYISRPAVAHRGLYRCLVRANGQHFDSTAANCEGQIVEGLLGYLRA